MARRQGRLLKIVGLLFGTIGSLWSAPALAHVKWFCAYDLAGAPLGLENVLCQDFEELVGLSIALLLAGAIVEGTALGRALLRSLDAVTGPVARHTELIVRVVAAAFFLSLWSMLHVVLTPELTTQRAFVPWLQLGIAVSMLSRATLPIGALGIAILFATGIADYGLFHLLDYPVFLGLAGYLACVGLGRTVWRIEPLDILRWAAGITLMWASVEKWAYPQWTYPMFVTHPEVSFGLDIGLYMRAAGVVEFALAFALIWTPLVRRTAAIILAAMFIAAVGEFGVVDAIGHSCIIAVLLAIAADPRQAPVRRRALALMPVSYSGALAVFLAAYYGLHIAFFGGGAF